MTGGGPYELQLGSAPTGTRLSWQSVPVAEAGKPTYTGIYTVGNHTEVVTIRTGDGILF